MIFEPYPQSRGVISATHEPGKDPALLPCPFCGGEPEVGNTHTASYVVECETCLATAHGRPFPGRSRRAHRAAMLSAIAFWNRRAPASSKDADHG